MIASNPIGLISMFYARPFLAEHFPLFARMKRAGIDVVELLVPEEGELDLGETRKAAEGAGLSIVLAARVNPMRDLSSSDNVCFESGVAYLEYCIEAASRLGAPVVGGPLYGAPLVFAGRAPQPVTEDERRRRVDQVVAGLKRASKRAEYNGVLLGIEPLHRFETDVCNTCGHALELVEAIGSHAAGVMLDTFHMNMEEFDMADAIRRAGARLVHFQANENNRGFVGSGHVDWPAICGALVDAGYRGPVVLEPFRRDDERAGVPLAQWRAPKRDEDGELAASVDFLRGALKLARFDQKRGQK